MNKTNKKTKMKLWIDALILWSSKEKTEEQYLWLTFVKDYLEMKGWNKQAINDFVEWGEYGFNNKDLHKEYTKEEFYSEVMYCSDRMSLDRLFRCHVMFRNLKKEKQSQVVKKK